MSRSRPPLPPVSASQPWYALSTSRLMIGVLFVLLFIIAARIPVDTDTWWHVRIGQQIVATHSIPFSDSFSFTKVGAPWIDQSWLAQIVLYGVYAAFGSVGLALFTAVLATVGMAFVFATCRGSVYMRGFVAILSAATAAVFWSARPQMFSFTFSAITLYLIYRYVRQPDSTGRRELWLLVPLLALWVNLHSGFAIAFIFLGAALAGTLINRPARRPTTSVRPLLLVTLIGIAALLINPYTVQMLAYPFQTAGIGALQQSIREWASPNFHERETWPFLLLLFGLLAAAGFSRRGWDWVDLALVVASAVLALVWQRNFAVFAVAVAPALCDHLDTILANLHIALPESAAPTGSRRGVNLSILAGLILVAAFKLSVALNPTTIAEAQRAYLPVEAATYLQTAAPAGPLFNSYNWGGYLMFAAPRYPVFIDGRTDLYGSAFFDQWQQAINGIGWQALFSQWGIRLAVIERDSVLAAALRTDPAWAETHSDPLASVFEYHGSTPVKGSTP